MYTPQDCADQFDAWAGVATTKSYASPEDADWCRGRADAFSDAALYIRQHCVPYWTRDLPTEPGAYWVRRQDGRCITAELREIDGELVVDLITATIPVPPDHEWAGPLPSPEDKATL